MNVEDFSMPLNLEDIWHFLFMRKMPNSSDNSNAGIF